jgi:hypothetical protein
MVSSWMQDVFMQIIESTSNPMRRMRASRLAQPGVERPQRLARTADGDR